MFYHINGIVTDLEPNLAVIDCGGVGYALNTSAYTISALRRGEKAKLYTHLIVREDCFDLYGFYSLNEKRCFEMLIGVSGVGPKAAVSILSIGTPEALMTAIIGGNEKALTAAPGIGKKIAQRIVLELQDKMGKEAKGMDMGFAAGIQTPAAFDAGAGRMADAAAALSVLGYSSQEVAAAMKGIDCEANSLEDIVRLALKNMMK